MTWGALGWLHLAWIVPALVVLLVVAARSRKKALSQLTLEVPEELTRRRTVQGVLTVLGVVFLVIAALQPRWGFTWREFESQGIEVVFVLDLSRSMDAEDVRPSRLERARHELIDLSEQLGGSRMGLVIFAGGAYPRVPLTQDRAALLNVIDESRTSSLRAQGSDLGEGIRVALDLLADGREGEAAIVVLSDGESWSESLDDALARAKEADVRIYTMAIGTDEGAPIPLEEGGFKRWQGEVVVSRLQPKTLERVAAETGGAFIHSVAGASDSVQVSQALLTTLEAQSMQVRREKVWDERYQWPLGAGIALLVLAGLVGDGRRFALLAVLLAPAIADAAELEEAYRLMDAQRHDEAVEVLTELQLDEPGDPFIQTALAESLYRSGRYEEAAETWEDIAERTSEPELQAQSRYNAGHARYQQGLLEASAENFEAAGEHPGASENAQQVRQEIDARRNPPPPQPEQQPQQQPQDGEPQPEDGEPQPQEPQDGEPPPDDGDSQQQEPQEGEGQEPQPPQGEGKQDPKDAEEGSDGTRPETPEEQGEDSEERQPTAGNGEAQEPSQEEPTEGQASTAGGEEEQGMSPEEARKLLDSVEEGTPHVVVRGESRGKDW